MRASSTSTALATIVAAASARAALVASTVTLSAMPSEKLRPRQPEVAMPRTGDAAAIVKRPSSGKPATPRRGSAQTPTSNDVPGVSRKAMSPPLLIEARAMRGSSKAPSSSSATLPATAAIAVMKRPPSRMRSARRDHAPRHRPARQHGRAGREIGAQQRQLADELGEQRLEARPRGLDRRCHGADIAVGRDDAVDRAVLEVPAIGVEPAPHRAGLRARAHRPPPAGARSGHGTPGSAPTTRQPPAAITSSRRRTRSTWPPSAR